MSNQELAQYLSTLATVAGGGALLWLLMGLLVKAVPALDQNGEAKFWLAFIGSFIIPVGALAVKAAINGETTMIAEWVTAISTGFQISQGVHRATSEVKDKLEANAIKARDEEAGKQGKGQVIPQGHTPYVAPIAPAAPRFEDVDETNSGDMHQPFDGERGPSGGL